MIAVHGYADKIHVKGTQRQKCVNTKIEREF